MTVSSGKWCGLGTKVFRKKDGMVLIIPPSIEYQPEADEVELHEIRQIDLHFPVHGAITAEIEMFPSLEVVYLAKPEFYMNDGTGSRKRIWAIEFTDGSKLVI